MKTLVVLTAKDKAKLDAFIKTLEGKAWLKKFNKILTGIQQRPRRKPLLEALTNYHQTQISKKAA